MASASFWATWDYHKAVLPTLARRLGKPIDKMPDEKEATKATHELKLFGVLVEEGAGVRIHAKSIEEYKATPC